jgi:hydroxymethylpyrimidine kinase/phosphomethylpyrimidine kinase
LSGLPPDPETDPDVLIAALRNRGARAVLLKGGHAAGDQSTDILDDGVSRLYLSSPRQNVRHTHGTGCVLSSAIAAFVARGRSVEESVELAKAYINQGLRHGGGIGRGRGPLAFLGWPDNPEDRPQMIRVRDGQT